MVGSTEEATSRPMREALRSRLGLWDGIGDEMICAHLASAYDRLAYCSFGDRRQLAPASILPRQLTSVPVDASDVIALAATLLGARLDSVVYTPTEHGELAPLASAPVATRSRRRELVGTSHILG